MAPLIWRLVGFVGQAVFGSRFLVQWIVSERRQESVIPQYFWYASLLGALLLTGYAVYIKDPVFIIGQSFGVLVYVRNIRLRRNHRRAEA